MVRVNQSTWLITLSSLAAMSGASLAMAQPAASPGQLQSLVNDAVAQIQLSYRRNPAELHERYQSIGQAVAAWNKSSRSEADGERLAEWLRQAMRGSMPGSEEPLPPVPEFERPTPPAEEMPIPTRPTPLPQPEASQAAPATVREVSANVQGSPAAATKAHDLMEGDPFRDDPIQDEPSARHGLPAEAGESPAEFEAR
jgi:hypothetical protein